VFDPNSNELDPISNEFDPNSSGFDPNSPRFDSDCPGFDPNSPGFDPNNPGFDTIAPRSIPASSGTTKSEGGAEKAVLKNVHNKKNPRKQPSSKILALA
jgi:hypothetical protein